MANKMTWVKLSAGYLRDEKIHFIVKRYGHDTMVFWTGLLTECKNGILEMPEEVFAEICLLEQARFDEIKKVFMNENLISISANSRICINNWPSGIRSGDFVNKRIRIAIPNWLKVLIFTRDGKKCRYCGSCVNGFEIDHVKPVSRGGDNSEDNLVVACIPCNRSKSDSTVEQWEARLG